MLSKNKFLTVVFILLLDCLNFLPFREVKFQYVSCIIGMYFLLYPLYNRHKLSRLSTFGVYCVLLFLTSCLSLFPNIFLLKQTPFMSIVKTFNYCIPLLYFWLKINKISSKDLLSVISVIGTIYCFIMIIQQITYPHILFARLMNNEVSERNGMPRFFLSGVELATFFCYYRIYLFFKQKSWKNFFVCLLGLATIFFNLGRIGYLECAIAIIILYTNKNFSDIRNWGRILLVGILGIIVLQNISLILDKEMIEMTKEDLTDEDYIRNLSYEYFFSESISRPEFFLFGHGNPVGKKENKYAQMMADLNEDQHFFVSDTGIVGHLYIFGFINIIVVALTMIKIIKESLRVRYIFAYSLITFLFWFIIPIYMSNGQMIIMAIMMYLLERKLLEQNDKTQQSGKYKELTRRG